MKIDLVVSPPKLIRWLTQKEKKLSVMMLDFEADLDTKKAWRLDVNVAFNAVAVSRGVVKQKEYYIGCTGGAVTIELNDGEIFEYTPAAKLDVTYKISDKLRRKAGLSLSPDIKATAGK